MPAQSAVHIKNTSSQTVPAGTMSIFADGGFAGEVMLQRLKPNRSQIARYGVKLDLELELVSRASRDEPHLLMYRAGKLVEHYVRKHEQTYRVKNRSGSGRRVYLGLDVVNNSRITGAVKSGYEKFEGKPGVEFEVPPRSEPTKTVHIEEGLRRERPETRLTLRDLDHWAGASTLPAAQRTILAAAVKAWQATERLDAKLAQVRIRLETEREGYRKDLQALGFRDEDAEELVKLLTGSESQRRTAQRQLDELSAERARAKRRVHHALTGLSIGKHP